MRNLIKLIFLSLLTLLFLSSCDAFPEFEGTYTGVLTITYQTYNYDLQTSATVEIERNFKDISSSYTMIFGTFTLGGKIDNDGNFSATQSGINDLGAAYTIQDQGQIVIGTGIYTSNITVIENGVTTIQGTLVLEKK